MEKSEYELGAYIGSKSVNTFILRQNDGKNINN